MNGYNLLLLHLYDIIHTIEVRNFHYITVIFTSAVPINDIECGSTKIKLSKYNIIVPRGVESLIENIQIRLISLNELMVIVVSGFEMCF